MHLLIHSYDRSGGLSSADFLAKWTYASNGKWRYPEENGFLLEVHGLSIMGNLTLAVGTTVYRSGSEKGTYIGRTVPITQSPKFCQFNDSKKKVLSQCPALPPSTLGHYRNNSAAFDYPPNYYVYEVAMPLDVVGEPIRPWFGQPDLGAQFYVGGKGTILALV